MLKGAQPVYTIALDLKMQFQGLKPADSVPSLKQKSGIALFSKQNHRLVYRGDLSFSGAKEHGRRVATCTIVLAASMQSKFRV